MNPRQTLASFGLVLGAVLLASVAGVVAGRIAPGSGAVAASLVAAAVLAATFAWRPLEGLLAFLLTALLVDTVEYWARADIRYLDEATIPLLAVADVVIHHRRIRLPRLGLREAGLAVFLVAALASTFLNAVPINVWLPGLVLLAKGVAFFYLVVSLRFDADELRRGLLVAFGFALAITVIGLVEFLAPDTVRGAFGLPPSSQQRGDVTVVTSIFRHPALYGWLTAFASLFLYARFAIDRAPWALPLALLMNVGTLISGRRTPLIGIVAGLMVGAARQLRVGRDAARTWIAVGAVVVLAAILALPFLSSQVRATLTDYVAPPELIREIFSPDPDPQVLRTMQPRIGLYLGSVAIARDNFPLGEGIGRFGSHMSREVYSPVYAEYGMDGMYGIAEMWPIAVTDTFWPMILGEAGVLGLIGAGLFFATIGWELWRAAALGGSLVVRVLLLGALLVFVETLVRSLTSSVFVAPPIAYWVFGVFGLALSVARADGDATSGG
ncbi:MAG TPA: hypothetical protein VHR55_10615 [Candidatus Limnocylindria bacterium]|nr:hypothetical protein [Candidatus Limnocylindria bacterium]